MHFYLLVQIQLMTGKIDAFLDAAMRKARKDRAATIASPEAVGSFPIAQLIAAERTGERNRPLRIMVLTTLVAAPKAHPVVPGYSTSRGWRVKSETGLGSSFFGRSWSVLPACRLQSFGAGAGAGPSARLCGDCRARRYPSNSSGDGVRQARAWFRTRRAGRSADCIGRQTR